MPLLKREYEWMVVPVGQLPPHAVVHTNIERAARDYAHTDDTLVVWRHKFGTDRWEVAPG